MMKQMNPYDSRMLPHVMKRFLAFAIAAVLAVASPAAAFAGVTSQEDVDAQIAAAQSAINAADYSDSLLPGLMDNLRDAYDRYLGACDGVQAIADERVQISEQLAELDACDELTEELSAFAQEQLDDMSALDVFIGIVTGRFDHTYLDMLEHLASFDGPTKSSANQREELEKKDASLAKKFSSEKADVQQYIDTCNEIALEIERTCSEIRYGDSLAGEAIGAIDDTVIGIDNTRAQLAYIQSVHREDRMAASALAGEWYDILDGLSGSQRGNALTFGAGAEFALTKDEFIEKWGAAIDKFYDAFSQTVGTQVPLCGYGEAMARAAWYWRIDPRLCAAVSIQESSGGLYCIRPHNAWGWGAADSDPYGLAYEWGSWEEAINEWHELVASSTTGLAAADSIETFGEIYATDPNWPASVANYLSEISLRAR